MELPHTQSILIRYDAVFKMLCYRCCLVGGQQSNDDIIAHFSLVIWPYGHDMACSQGIIGNNALLLLDRV